MKAGEWADVEFIRKVSKVTPKLLRDPKQKLSKMLGTRFIKFLGLGVGSEVFELTLLVSHLVPVSAMLRLGANYMPYEEAFFLGTTRI